MGTDVRALGALGRVAHAIVQAGTVAAGVAQSRTELEVVFEVKPAAGLEALKTGRVRRRGRAEHRVDRRRGGVAPSKSGASMFILVAVEGLGGRGAERGRACAGGLEGRVWGGGGERGGRGVLGLLGLLHARVVVLGLGVLVHLAVAAVLVVVAHDINTGN